MEYKNIEPSHFPAPQAVWTSLPLTAIQSLFIQQARQTVINILRGRDKRLLIVTGPCSIHDPIAAYEYALHLQSLMQEMNPYCFLIMRMHFEKPRTGKGWKGWLSDPDLDGSYHMEKGIMTARQLLLQMAQAKIAVSTEFLDPLFTPYLADLITWATIGARTVSSPLHRQLASTLPMPIGFKNTIDGNVTIAMQASLSAKEQHTFLGFSAEGTLCKIRSAGNFDTHIILRGGIEKSNYDAICVKNTIKQLQSLSLLPRLMIDCAHANAKQHSEGQQQAWETSLMQIINGETGIFGMMLESNLKAGTQSMSSSLQHGVSITDACLDWATTERLIRMIAKLAI